jgi:hypothetical protein
MEDGIVVELAVNLLGAELVPPPPMPMDPSTFGNILKNDARYRVVPFVTLIPEPSRLDVGVNPLYSRLLIRFAFESTGP